MQLATAVVAAAETLLVGVVQVAAAWSRSVE